MDMPLPCPQPLLLGDSKGCIEEEKPAQTFFQARDVAVPKFGVSILMTQIRERSLTDGEFSQYIERLAQGDVRVCSDCQTRPASGIQLLAVHERRVFFAVLGAFDDESKRAKQDALRWSRVVRGVIESV